MIRYRFATAPGTRINSHVCRYTLHVAAAAAMPSHLRVLRRPAASSSESQRRILRRPVASSSQAQRRGLRRPDASSSQTQRSRSPRRPAVTSSRAQRSTSSRARRATSAEAHHRRRRRRRSDRSRRDSYDQEGYISEDSTNSLDVAIDVSDEDALVRPWLLDLPSKPHDMDTDHFIELLTPAWTLPSNVDLPVNDEGLYWRTIDIKSVLTPCADYIVHHCGC